MESVKVLSDAGEPGAEAGGDVEKRSRVHYSLELKMMLLDQLHQQPIAVRTLARANNMEESIIRRWRNNEKQIRAKYHQKLGTEAGTSVTHEMDHQLMSWIRSKKAEGLPVCPDELKLEASLYYMNFLNI